MTTLRSLMAQVLLALLLAGLPGGDAGAATAPGHAGMAADLMPDCDGCGGDAAEASPCAVPCGASCTADFVASPGAPGEGLMLSAGYPVSGIARAPGAAVSPDPPRPRPGRP